MKFSIAQHRQMLINSKSHLDSLERELERVAANVKKSARRVSLYEAQIALAEKEGKDGFDSDKYAINRLCV